MTFTDRVQAKASEVRVARLLLSVLAGAFWLVGMFVGVVFVAVRWAWAALVVGFSDVANR